MELIITFSNKTFILLHMLIPSKIMDSSVYENSDSGTNSLGPKSKLAELLGTWPRRESECFFQLFFYKEEPQAHNHLPSSKRREKKATEREKKKKEEEVE